MIKMEASDLGDVISEAFNRGYNLAVSEVSTRVQESTKALLAENSKLKAELDKIEALCRGALEGSNDKREALEKIFNLVLKGGVL